VVPTAVPEDGGGGCSSVEGVSWPCCKHLFVLPGREGGGATECDVVGPLCILRGDRRSMYVP
jgi:hypothetical protein